MNEVSPSNVLSFMEIVGKLKRTKRTGWVRSGIQLPESVADHSFRMAMLSNMITDPNVNKSKLLKMCLIHDLAESIVGDITPHCNVSDEDKHSREKDAMESIVNTIDNSVIGNEILSLWTEYEERQTAESEIAYQLDKFEMIYQADEYERLQNAHLPDFFESTKNAFSHAEVLAWANELRENRRVRIEQEGGHIVEDA